MTAASTMPMITDTVAISRGSPSYAAIVAVAPVRSLKLPGR